MEICFIIFGIASLLAWNAILSDISFFMNYLEKYDPSTAYSFCNFALNILFQLVLIWKKQFISYKLELILGLIFSIISLVFLPIVVISFEKNSLTGFILSAGLVLIQGLINALCTSGFFGLTSFFPMKMIISLSTGQGLSGILMNIIGYMVLASINTGVRDDDEKLGAIIYFSISGFILLITLVILIISFKTDYFKYYLEKTEEFNKVDRKIEIEIENQPITTKTSLASENEEPLVEEKQPEDKKEEKEEKKQEDKKEEKEEKQPEDKKEEIEGKTPKEKVKEITFVELFKRLYEIDILSCLIYVITFACFPSISICQRLFKTGKYRALTIITIYNVGDTIGRFIMSSIKFQKKLAYIIICGRSILVVVLILNFYFDMRLGMDPNLSSIFLIIYVATLAITNGMGTTLCLGLAPSMVPDSMKGRAGSSVGFFNILGIFLGTCLAYLTKYIMTQIGEYKEEE